MLKIVVILLIALIYAPTLTAQEEVPTTESITYDSVVMDNISNGAIYDWWFIDASEADTIVVTMTASGALEPLIGLLDPDGNLMARSEDGTPGGTISLEYVAPAAGLYTIVATRAGNENGTSTGDYELQVRRANTPIERINPYQQVTFRCSDYEVTNAVSLEFADDDPEFYRISVYGLDGFQPVIRVSLSSPEVEDCSRDARGMGGDMVTLPGAETLTIALPENEENSAQLTIGGNQLGSGLVSLTIGSKDGVPGRYIAVIEGFSLSPANDTDFLRIGQGPKATDLPLLVYMVSDKGTRLDPAMTSSDEMAVSEFSVVCDDAGRRGCEDVASINGLDIQITAGGAGIFEIEGSRFDAGALFPLGDPQQMHSLELSSFAGNTEGGYSLVLIGALDDD